jgi:phenylpropionate dioxygenase-like ring-hydroxylating dioxygenase large terminal subunit
MFLRNYWYAAGWSRDFSVGTPTGVTMLNDPIVIYRRGDGVLAALQDRCCHRFAPLSMGRVEGDNLRCMYHGLKFDPSGKCIEIPGQPKIPPQARVRCYPILDQHSVAWIWMGDPALADESLIPDFVGIDDPRWVMKPGRMDYKANYMLINDNLLDLSHLAYVHRKTFGAAFANGENQAWAETRPHITRLPRGLRVERWQMSSPAPPFLSYIKDPSVDMWNTYDFLVPGFFLLRADIYPQGTAAKFNQEEPSGEPLHSQFTCQAVTPLTDQTTCYIFAYGPWPKDAALCDAFLDLGKAAFEEDRIIIEAQQKVIDMSPAAKMITTSFDSGVSQFRRMMDELMRNEPHNASSAAAGG